MSTPTRMLKPEFLSTHVDINIESYGMLGSAQVSTRTEKLLTANFTAQNQKHFQNLLIVEPLHAVLRIQKKVAIRNAVLMVGGFSEKIFSEPQPVSMFVNKHMMDIVLNVMMDTKVAVLMHELLHLLA